MKTLVKTITHTLLCTVAAVIPRCALAQDPPPFHSCTVDVAGGFLDLPGKYGGDFRHGWNNFQAGGGFAVIAPHDSGNQWSLFITANFLFNQSAITAFAFEAVEPQVAMNSPAAPASGKGRFYATTLDPTFRLPRIGRVTAYGLAGFGWFRRELEFNGQNPATVLQPNGAVVFGQGGNSGAIDFGGGLNAGLTKGNGPMVFVEVRYVQGLAINSGTKLIPVSMGIRW
jgi:hypothetical protein